MTARYEILEHTADVGLRLTADSLEGIFEVAGEGFATLQDAWVPGEGEGREVRVVADDAAGLLVAWIDELLFLQESEEAVFGGFDVDLASETELRASVRLAPRGDRDLEAVGIKAATYHRLRLERRDDGWLGEIYLDV